MSTVSSNESTNVNDSTVINRALKEKQRGPAKTEFFEPLTDQTMIEKVRLTVKLHTNNYFIDKPESEFSSIEPAIRPNKAVPSNFKVMFRDFSSKNKRLAWVMQNIEKDFCNEFKEKYPAFKKLAVVHDLAAKI
jgi:hypothetical protein